MIFVLMRRLDALFCFLLYIIWFVFRFIWYYFTIFNHFIIFILNQFLSILNFNLINRIQLRIHNKLLKINFKRSDSWKSLNFILNLIKIPMFLTQVALISQIIGFIYLIKILKRLILYNFDIFNSFFF